jgi:peptide deformylase
MNKTEFKIKIIGDPVLRKKSKTIKTVTSRHKDILSKMAQIMYDAKGVGLAAPQVGINEALIVVDTGSGLYKIINPRIIKKEGIQAIEEGCLSVPGVTIKVKRAKKVLLHGLDPDGNSLTFEVENILACVFQHEIDHLSGKLIIDYAPMWKRFFLKKKLRKKEVPFNA